MLGRFLFRRRGVIGLAAFGVVFWLARPTFGSCFAGVPFLLVGLALRFWASGYIGIEGRAREIGASRRIVSGPYPLLRHPLYIGNFMLVCGMLVALRPALWLAVVVLAGFCVEYAVIAVAEEKELSGRRSQMSDERCEMSEVGGGEDKEARGERRESLGRSQKSDERCEMSEVRTGGQSPQSLVGSPESIVQRPESFLMSRALCEWRTWVATGVAFGLAVAKAAARS